jgi:hypothetical protein
MAIISDRGLVRRFSNRLSRILPVQISSKSSVSLSEAEYAKLVGLTSNQYTIGYQEAASDLSGLLIRSKGFENSTASSVLDLYKKHDNICAVIIGNGPSVRLSDLERFGKYLTFACNKFYLSYESHAFRPNYTISCDNQVIQDHGEDIAQKSSGEVIFSVDPDMNYSAPEGIVTLKRTEYDIGSQVFHPTPFFGLPSMGSVIIMGIQLAYFMGCNPILVYGVDHSFKVDLNNDRSDRWRLAANDNNHFIKDYRQGRSWCPPDIPRIEEGFSLCYEYLSKRAVDIVNISRESSLNELPKASFDSLVSD